MPGSLFYILADLQQAAFAKAIEIGLRKKAGCFMAKHDIVALAISDIAFFAGKQGVAAGTGLFFVFAHGRYQFHVRSFPWVEVHGWRCHKITIRPEIIKKELCT